MHAITNNKVERYISGEAKEFNFPGTCSKKALSIRLLRRGNTQWM